MRFTIYDMLMAPYEESDPGASGTIAVTRFGAVFPLRTSAAESRTMQAPYKPGIYCTLVMDEDGGDCTVTFADAINSAGNTTATFNDVGDLLHMISVTAPSADTGHKWMLIKNTGCSLSS